MKVFRVSGVRLDPNSHLFAAQFETCVQQALKLGLKIFQEAQREPFLFYDNEKNKPIYQLIQSMLLQGELFFPEVNNEVIGYAAFRNIQPTRYANLEIYLSSGYRKSRTLGEFRASLESSAFAKYPDGLQLLKLKASIHPGNYSSLKACKNSGFVALCDLPLEGLWQGQLSTMIYLEKYSPEITALMKPQEISSNGKHPVNPSNPKLRSSSDLHQRVELKPVLDGLQRGTLDISIASALPDSELPQQLSTSKQRSSRRRGPRAIKPVPEPSNPT